MNSLKHPTASGVLLLIAFGLPLLLIVLGRLVIPHAPGSEFSLLVMVGLVAAFLTKHIGVYYLVGAFLTGFAARQLREKMPTLASDSNLHAIALFASFFVPFYFFYSGMNVPQSALQWESLWLGLTISVAVLPLRVGIITMQRNWLHGDFPDLPAQLRCYSTREVVGLMLVEKMLKWRWQIDF